MPVPTPKVTVLCVTYNHEKYLRQCLESLVTQKTDFAFDVIVGDDCSTDGNADILREFASKYPQIIKPIYREKNWGGGANFRDLLLRAKSDYIALCEGDDFFTDVNKLQLQADFLDRHPHHTLCFNLTRIFFENAEQADSIYPDLKSNPTFNTEELLKWNFMQTSSVMYRRQDYEKFPTSAMIPGDWYLHLFHAKAGEIGFINQVLSAYRRHALSVWWSAIHSEEILFQKHGIGMLRMLTELISLFGDDPAHRKIIMGHAYGLINRLVDMDAKSEAEKKIFNNSSVDVPQIAIDVVQSLRHELLQTQAELERVYRSKKWRVSTKVDELASRFRVKTPLMAMGKISVKSARLVKTSLLGKPGLCSVCNRVVPKYDPLPAFYEETARKFGFDHMTSEWETLNAKAYHCPLCGASDRDRLIALLLRQKLEGIKNNFSLIDFAPSASLSAMFKPYPALKYQTADLFMPNVDYRLDITKMPLPDSTFDSFICSHVLEHVQDDRLAMQELHRILKPGGWGIVLVPISTRLTEIREGLKAETDEQRWRWYGQNDHIRLYNRQGFVDRLSGAGFSVRVHDRQSFPKDNFEACGLTPTSTLYEVVKDI